MRKFLFFAVCCLLFFSAHADAPKSFLTAQSFPKTFSDLPFTERMNVLRAGYEPYEIEYDADGYCISGCAFTGMRLQDTVEYYKDQAEIAARQADILRAQHPEWAAAPTAPIIQQQPVQPIQIINPTTPQPFPTPVQTPPTTVATSPVTPPVSTPSYGSPGACKITTDRQGKINPSQTVPYGYPMNIPMKINSRYGPRSVSNGSRYHMGADLRAADGTPVFSTLRGEVVNVTYNPRGSCGNHVKIQSPDGFAIRFCHMQDIMVKKGEILSAGCMIGKSGHSGIGRAGKPYPPHLHYEIFNQNNKQIPPEPYFE